MVVQQSLAVYFWLQACCATLQKLLAVLHVEKAFEPDTVSGTGWKTHCCSNTRCVVAKTRAGKGWELLPFS